MRPDNSALGVLQLIWASGGVCSAQLAHRALRVERSIGLLLPCTVVVRATDDATIVEALAPQVMVDVPGDERRRPMADDAGKTINAALDQLAD